MAQEQRVLDNQQDQVLAPAQEKTAIKKSKLLNKSLVLNLLPLVSLILLAIIFTIGNPNFLSTGNIFNILRQSSLLLIVCSGITFIILMGSIDLSFGSIVTLSGVITALTIVSLDMGTGTGLLAGVLIGGVCGLINGIIFAYLRVPSFLATLGTMFAIDGISLMLMNGSPIPINNNSFMELTRGTLIGKLPNIAIWALVVYGIMCFVGFKTRFGRYMFAIGGGELVAKMAGVAVNKFKVYGFIVTGLLAGLAGTLMASRIGSATPRMGDGLLLDAIAAVVIGGTALTGGVGGPHRALLGVLLIAVLGNGMDILSVDPYLQIVIKGVVVVLAVAIGLDRKKISLVK